ncbi:TetR/AcrR family transcriptional regulator [Phenylobacterium sp.]|uniref:TetR/AcrR family transcriptional regulator n=1 Tax=Phenylobacterium sp. TaxID=1871053 RepID=UPI00289F6158|nr:TetR/AcrR family transcriptional regulator [Phenylobacterium sp.]
MKQPRRRQPEATRAQIIGAAMRTLQESGAAGFTLDAVVARLPVSKGALLHHFPSKAELLKALVDEAGEKFANAVEAQAARDPHRVGRYARAYLAATVELTMSEEDVRTSKVVLIACLLEPALADRWRWWTDRITRDEPNDVVGADDALLQRLVADGLWLSDVFGTRPVPMEQRRVIGSLMGASPLRQDAPEPA